MDTRAKTARNWKHVGRVYRAVQREQLPSRVLDYGACYGLSRAPLEASGHRWVGYDIHPRSPGIQSNLEEIKKTEFDIIMVSNVLNVQETEEQLYEVLNELASLRTESYYMNYPHTPRKLGWSKTRMKDEVAKILGKKVFWF